MMRSSKRKPAYTSTVYSRPKRIKSESEAEAEPSALSPDQRAVIAAVTAGENVFFTGAAGSGKSFLLQHIIRLLKRKYASDPFAVQITAPTGLAAVQLGGQTLHSFAGVGLGAPPVRELIRCMAKTGRSAMERWAKTKVLIIDEISMCDGGFLDKLYAIANEITGRGRFGGIQLIFAGDFYQLPPVSKPGARRMFAFDSKCWQDCISRTFELRTVFRQQKDAGLARLLNNIRIGNVPPSTIDEFVQLARPLDLPKGLRPTVLFPVNSRVDEVNCQRLAALPGGLVVHKAVDVGRKRETEQFFRNLRVAEVVELKIGAQVMCLQNIAELNVVNGSLGQVIAYVPSKIWKLAAGNGNGDLAGNGRILPDIRVRLQVIVDIAQRIKAEKPNGMKQMKLTFVRSHSAYKTLLNASERQLVEKILVGGLLEVPKEKVYPVVDFVDRGLVIMKPQLFELPDPRNADKALASRSQIPLGLAWALSIHKAQGQTLQYVQVDLSRAFESGQAYVALSRVRSRSGLQVLGFSRGKVHVDPRVVEFYRELAERGRKEGKEG